MENGGPYALRMKGDATQAARHPNRIRHGESPQVQRVREIDHILTNRGLLGGRATADREIASDRNAQIDRKARVTRWLASLEQRRRTHVRVWKAVQQDDGKPVWIAALVIPICNTFVRVVLIVGTGGVWRVEVYSTDAPRPTPAHPAQKPLRLTDMIHAGLMIPDALAWPRKRRSRLVLFSAKNLRFQAHARRPRITCFRATITITEASSMTIGYVGRPSSVVWNGSGCRSHRVTAFSHPI